VKKENNRKNIPVFGGHELQTVKELSEQKENGFDCPRLGSIFFRKVFSTRLINKLYLFEPKAKQNRCNRAAAG
jgi:uncharacterized C2H2 Zn-finger protein